MRVPLDDAEGFVPVPLRDERLDDALGLRARVRGGLFLQLLAQEGFEEGVELEVPVGIAREPAGIDDLAQSPSPGPEPGRAARSGAATERRRRR